MSSDELVTYSGPEGRTKEVVDAYTQGVLDGRKNCPPMHTEAPAMYEALRAMYDWRYVKRHDYNYERVRALLARIEGVDQEEK